jgi:hypothetical protein
MATTTITTTSAEDARIVAAFGFRLSLGRNATAAEVKAEIGRFVTNVVKDYEVAAAGLAAAASAPVSPT